MNYKVMLRIISWILIIELICMVPPFLIAMATGDHPSVFGFGVAIVVAAVIGFPMLFITRRHHEKFYAREGILTTTLSWIVMSLVGALPFYLSGRIPKYLDAFFEIISGFTTTGASILSDVEALGKALLFWRSFSHWLGGMGVLVFFLALISASSKDEGYSLHLLRAESPGPTVGKIVPRMKDTAVVLYKIYIVMTVINVVLLLIAKMPVFDAFCIAFGTAGTGGFAVLNSGLATYTPLAQNITTIFMLLFGVNFSIYFYMTRRKGSLVIHNQEFRAYFLIVFVSTVLVTINVLGKTPETAHVGTALRHSAFTVASVITTTGYSTTDFNLWPGFAKAILLCLMFCGASAGSTGGGIKVSRVLILLKSVRRNTHAVFNPSEIRTIRMDGGRVSEHTLRHVSAYLSAYVFIVMFSFLILSADPAGYDMETNFSAVMATFNNIGPGFNAVGPTQNFSGYSDFSTLVMCFDMLLGRLEIYPILVMFARATYRKA